MLVNVWNSIGSVTSGIALAAFVVAAALEAMRRVLTARERQIASAPERDRLALAQALNDSFLVQGKPIDTGSLTREQQYTIILTQIRDRARRFYLVAGVSLAIAIGALAVFAYTRTHRISSTIGG